ncbi:MAG: CvpA family protein [Desulfovibrio sp.]|jgi:membrane protein required for colicin V production|nr:CvpA family protein [Desulfovibrio sp.]
MMENLNLLDAGFALVLVLFLARGLLRGIARELVSLAGLVLGLWAAGSFYPHLVPSLIPAIANEKIAAAVAYALVFLAAFLLVLLLAALLRKFMTLAFAPWLDHLLGGIVGTAKGLLLCAVAMALLEHLTPESPFLQESLLAKRITEVSALVKAHLPAFL